MKRKLIIALTGAFLLSLSSCTIDTSLLPDHPDIIDTTLHEHTYNESVVEPTCDKAGYTLHRCNCGNHYEDNETEPLGHIVSEFYSITFAGDCKTKRKIKYVCSRCHNEVEDENGYGEHKLVSNEDGEDATCLEGGYTPSYHCALCDYEKPREVVEALGHEYEYNASIEATCTSDGYASSAICKRCNHAEGGIVIPKLGHDIHTVKKVSTYGYYTVDECSRGDSVVFKESFITDYTTNYDYIAFGDTSKYSKGAKYQEMYQNLYVQAIFLQSSTQDYTKDSSGYIKAGSYDYAANGLTIDEAGCIVTSFVQNNPQFYFLSAGYVYSSKTIYFNFEEDYAKASVRQEVNAAILSMEQDYINEFSKKQYTEKEAARLIHDFICNRIDYAYKSAGVPETAAWAHSMVGTAKKQGGVCEAYARTYLYLSKLSGLNTIIVAGLGNGGGHAWNYTKIGDEWYGVDVTWDDQSYGIISQYFLATKTTMDSEHKAGSALMSNDNQTFVVPLPTLSSTPLA